MLVYTNLYVHICNIWRPRIYVQDGQETWQYLLVSQKSTEIPLPYINCCPLTRQHAWSFGCHGGSLGCYSCDTSTASHNAVAERNFAVSESLWSRCFAARRWQLGLVYFLCTALKNGSRLRLLPVQERERVYWLWHGTCMKHDLPQIIIINIPATCNVDTTVAHGNVSLFVVIYGGLQGARGGVVVKALCYKPAGRGFDSRWCDWNFSVT
jgi:hypothetical protein